MRILRAMNLLSGLLSFGLMSHRLDPIAVGVADAGGVVVRVIFGPEAWLAVVASPGGERRRVEPVDRAAEGRREANMAAERGSIAVRSDPERQSLLLERVRLGAAAAGGDPGMPN